MMEKIPEYDIAGKTPKKYGFGIRHLQMACMCLTTISLFIARGSMGVAVLAMADESRKNESTSEIYDWDKKTQSVILSSFFWGYLAMQIPAGILAKKFGGKAILMSALIVNGVLCSLIPTLAAWGGWALVCIARLAIGLSQACLFPASHTLFGQWLPPSEITIFSGLVAGGAQIGTIISMPVCGILADTALGWKLIFFSMSGLLFFTAVIWYWFAAKSPSDHRMISKDERRYIEENINSKSGSGSQKSIPIPWKQILTSVPVWAIVVAHMGSSVSYVLFLVDMPNYLENGMQLSLKNSASLSALPYIGMWIGNLVCTIVAGKLTNKKIITMKTCRKMFNSIVAFRMQRLSQVTGQSTTSTSLRNWGLTLLPALQQRSGTIPKMYRFGMFGTAAGLVVLSLLGPENKVWAVTILVGTLTLTGGCGAGFYLNHLDLSPNFAGLLFSLTNFAANIGAVLMPIATGFILQNDSSDISRWRIVFLLTAVISVASNIFYMVFGTAERQDWNEPNYFDDMKTDPEVMKPVLNAEQLKNKEKADEAANH